ncbi:MAG: hypothetical protein ACK5XO_10655, partial [Phycisphaerales bacterium]
FTPVVAASALAIGGLRLLIPTVVTTEVALAVLGLVGGLGYFVYQQHLSQTELFAHLFEKFNTRYDAMNERLAELRASRKSLEEWAESGRQGVIDYFNLCAEEWLFFQAGYIDQRVWDAWYNGMKHYARDERFAAIWNKEPKDSYYGFMFPVPVDL